jgi:hypothetical protein
MKTNFKNLGRHGLSLLLAPCLLALFVCSSTAMAEGCCDLITSPHARNIFKAQSAAWPRSPS